MAIAHRATQRSKVLDEQMTHTVDSAERLYDLPLFVHLVQLRHLSPVTHLTTVDS